MNHYYGYTLAYASKFDPSKLFATQDEARAHDKRAAAAMIGAAHAEDVAAAFESHNPYFRAALEYALAELAGAEASGSAA